jgi:rhamnogalacturonan endolyase
MWTHIVANNHTMAPLPKRENLKKASFAQDATYDLSKYRDDPFVQQTSDYFTKYSFADTWKDHSVHGLYADGKGISPNSTTKWNIWKNVTHSDTWGAWMVMWNKETYYGGPLKSELTVDGIVYDYMGQWCSSLLSDYMLTTSVTVSNHYGVNVPNITAGFDRTFGPVRYR